MSTIDYSAIAQPILVTGANGFIGSHLVRRLAAQGLKVRAFLQPDTPVPADWPAKVERIYGDIGNRADVERALRGSKTVFHLAAIVGDWGLEADHRRVTIGGTEHVFALAGALGARVVLCSCSSVYGDEMRRGRCVEEQPMGVPASVYSEAKQGQERIAWTHCSRVHWSIVRPGNVYGPRGKLWGEDVLNLLRWRLPALIDGGRHVAGLSHIDNVVDVLALCAYRPEAKHQIFNASDDSAVTWAEYAADLARLHGFAPPRSLPGALVRLVAPLFETVWRSLGIKRRPPFTQEVSQCLGSDNRLVMDKARRLLDYTPQMQYRDAIVALEAQIAASRPQPLEPVAVVSAAVASVAVEGALLPARA